MQTAVDLSTKKKLRKNLKKDNRRRMKELFRIKGTQINMMILLFFASFAALHYVHNFVPDDLYQLPLRIIIKFIINAVLINIALIGMERVRQEYDRKLIQILILYALGDMASEWSVPIVASFYGVGHILFVLLLYKTTYIGKEKIIIAALLAAATAAAAALLHIEALANPWIFVVFVLYESVTWLFFVCAFRNPFYVLSGIVFVLSDITGLVRIAYFNIWWTYIITLFVYYLAIMLIAFSAFLTSKKMAVSLPEFRSMILTFQKNAVRFWVGGSWNINLLTSFEKAEIKDSVFVCDNSTISELQEALCELGYLERGERCDRSAELYNDKYGFIRILLLDWGENGATVHTLSGTDIEIEEEFFGEKVFGDMKVPYLTIGT